MKRMEEGGKFYELKFLSLILDYFNYHMCLAKRDNQSYNKVVQITKILPSFKEMRDSLDNYYVHADVSKFLL